MIYQPDRLWVVWGLSEKNGQQADETAEKFGASVDGGSRCCERRGARERVTTRAIENSCSPIGCGSFRSRQDPPRPSSQTTSNSLPHRRSRCSKPQEPLVRRTYLTRLCRLYLRYNYTFSAGVSTRSLKPVQTRGLATVQDTPVRRYGGLKDQDRIFTNAYCKHDHGLKGAQVRLQAQHERTTSLTTLTCSPEGTGTEQRISYSRETHGLFRLLRTLVFEGVEELVFLVD